MTQPPAIAVQPKCEAWHSQSAEDVLLKLGSAATGLSATEAAKRLAANGPNELEEDTPLEKKLNSFGRVLVWAALGIVALLFGLGLSGDA